MIKIQSVPTGIYSGDPVWDEKGHGEICQIFISQDANCIKCIQFYYVENGSAVLSPPYGEHNSPTFYPVQFNYPSEFLTRVSGTYTYDCVRSLTFTTNKGTYGPYGCKEHVIPGYQLQEFNFYMGENRQFGGFHGLSDGLKLKSIGVYVKPSATTQTSSVEIYKSKVDIPNIWP
ncbi:hypothetical protein P3X46_013806 [Hevea brasiliensis]|uniref:Jacalin-type lectin domain-containing protein n=1 Tax=Hevea brasiliensis TaxID=3981 RepID=A0ABQ9M4R7_HEVBR|nr:inactive protein RESTRICTED TEV MOVEMENT 1 [Hevea brasiliensis]KAJ9175229.1 hypothetical protein P3X46_013806 [Hevea brasiliensis]